MVIVVLFDIKLRRIVHCDLNVMWIFKLTLINQITKTTSNSVISKASMVL